MPITMKKALIAIKKHLDEFPEALDAPIFASHGVSAVDVLYILMMQTTLMIRS